MHDFLLHTTCCGLSGFCNNILAEYSLESNNIDNIGQMEAVRVGHAFNYTNRLQLNE